jgi:adenosine deaminase
MFALAKRNGVKLDHDSVEAHRAREHFSNLSSFLDLYYQGPLLLLGSVHA